MKLGYRRTIFGVLSTAAAWLVAVAVFSGQAASVQAQGAGQTLMAEQAFKNVTVLKGISVQDFMGTMGIFSAALGMSCEDCHNADERLGWAGYAVENPRKQRTRQMILMMQQINRANFGGRQLVTCYGCHRGDNRPKPTPTMDDVYGGFPPNNPADVIAQEPGAPTAESVFEKYIAAVGGAQRAAALKSYVGKGRSIGYGPEEETREFDLYVALPRRSTIVHTTSGDASWVYDGTRGYYAAPYRPQPVLDFNAGTDLEGAKIDALLSSPAEVRNIATKWRVGRPITIGDKDVIHVQGTGASGLEVSLYFDPDTNLLMRQKRYAPSPVGLVPHQIDYEDYRDVAGVKIPFRWTVSGINGRDGFQMESAQANAVPPAAVFNRPAPPAPITARPVRN